MFFAISNWVCNSNNDPMAIFKKRKYSLLLSRPNPSAILLGIDTELHLICDVNANISSFGNFLIEL
jgi:hypothetical protein